MTPIKVVLAEDHTLVRAGIRSLLEDLPDVTVVAEASDGREAIRMVREHSPDVVVTDIAMAGLNGLEAASRISKKYPKVKVLMLSMYTNEEYIIQALRSGAVGYLAKEAATSELAEAVRAVARGETYLSPSVSKKKLSDYLHKTTELTDPMERLTPRQREILQLVAEGKSTRNIAAILNVSIKTVETHRAQLMDRLEIYDVAGLVRYAIRSRVIPSE